MGIRAGDPVCGTKKLRPAEDRACDAFGFVDKNRSAERSEQRRRDFRVHTFFHDRREVLTCVALRPRTSAYFVTAAFVAIRMTTEVWLTRQSASPFLGNQDPAREFSLKMYESNRRLCANQQEMIWGAE